jgi:hypothetical protein
MPQTNWQVFYQESECHEETTPTELACGTQQTGKHLSELLVAYNMY